MNFIRILLANISYSIRRNPITCIVIALLLIAAPSLFGVLAIFLIAMALAFSLPLLLFMWKISSAQRRMEREFNNREYRQQGDTKHNNSRVRVVETEPVQKRVSDDVGEYVDFKEVKNSSDKNR